MQLIDNSGSLCSDLLSVQIRDACYVQKNAYITFGIFVLTAVYAVIEWQFIDSLGVIFWSIAVALQLLTILSVLIMYAKIYRVVLSHRKRMRDAFGRRRSDISIRERSRTHTVTIILAVFIACYAPYAVHSVRIILFYTGKSDYNRTLALWANYLVLLNSFLNPMIYCARSQEMRRAAVRIFMPNLAQKRNSVNADSGVDENRGGRTDQPVATTEL